MESSSDKYISFLKAIYPCKVPFSLEVLPTKPKKRLGTYYYRRRKIIIHEGWTGSRDCRETAIHEYAHHIHATEFRKKERKQKPHGREFWMIYGQLIWRAKMMNLYNDEKLPVIRFVASEDENQILKLLILTFKAKGSRFLIFIRSSLKRLKKLCGRK